VGENDVGHSHKPKGGRTWREAMRDQVKLDPSRVHWLGKPPYEHFLKVLRYVGVDTAWASIFCPGGNSQRWMRPNLSLPPT
jgi:hypothetical protein